MSSVATFCETARTLDHAGLAGRQRQFAMHQMQGTMIAHGTSRFQELQGQKQPECMQ
jgi:hypothetical protein